MDALWTPDVAEHLAEEEGFLLSEKHWRVITVARELIARTERAPSLAEVSAACSLRISEIQQLFPGAAEHLLAHFAGAPELERRKTS